MSKPLIHALWISSLASLAALVMACNLSEVSYSTSQSRNSDVDGPAVSTGTARFDESSADENGADENGAKQATATNDSQCEDETSGNSSDDRWWLRCGPDLTVTNNTANVTKSDNLDKVVEFLTDEQYKSWSHDPYIRPTGDIYKTSDGNLIDGMTHHRVRIYYSPDVVTWLENDRQGTLPDRSMIVKEMYNSQAPFYPVEDPVIGWAAMVKNNEASHGGWYWVIYFKPEFRSMDTVGEWSYSYCLTCHSSTKSQNTFAAKENLKGKNATNNQGRSTIVVAEPLFPLSAAAMSGSAPKHLTSIDKAFESLYSLQAIYPGSKVPKYHAEATGTKFPSTNWDHVWNRTVPEDRSYLTSDNCVGCHDATLLVETEVPNMLIQDPSIAGHSGKRSQDLLNLSVYGEWRTSPMGMAGRDPIFFAQLQSEMNTYSHTWVKVDGKQVHAPEYIQNTCLSCHGAMGQRQYCADTGKTDFNIPMVFETGDKKNAKYGALAREGISCMICHQMSPESVAKQVNSGEFERGPWNEIFGPTKKADPGGGIRTYPMEQALGFTPKHNAYITKSEMCGTCHTITLPVLENGNYAAASPIRSNGDVLMSRAHEQDTYSEWLYSAYAKNNPVPSARKGPFQRCQDCHMRSTYEDNPSTLNLKVANVQDTSWPIPQAENLASPESITVPTRKKFKRHTFFGMNLFVLNMYDQFQTEIFGVEPDPNAPMNAVDSQQLAIEEGEWQIKNRTASVDVTDINWEDRSLVANVRVKNKAGHRFPSGVGFRRAWIEFTVLDAKGKAIWSSGSTDCQGVILGPDGKFLESEFTDNPTKIQPHWEKITSQDQVQIYEERYVNKDANGRLVLNTSFLGIGEVVKENRVQPLGYTTNYLIDRHNRANTKEEKAKWQLMLPELSRRLSRITNAQNPIDDPAYLDGSGSDQVRYEIPGDQIKGAVSVEVKLNYQNIPPYYLRDRFATGSGHQTQRLYYLIGHLQTEGTAIENWKIEVNKTQAKIPPK